MASALKRKRGSSEVLESPKRTKAVLQSQASAAELDLSKVGWDAAFGPVKSRKEANNKVNGNDHSGLRRFSSPEAEDLQDFLKHRESTRAKKKEQKVETSVDKMSTWKISNPIGGRIMNIDPVFTQDEKFILIAHRKTVQVYSTSNSLLNRSIKLSVDQKQESNVHIVAFVLSPTESNIVWVAYSDGTVYSVDWTTGDGCERAWKISPMGVVNMTVASISSDGRSRDILFTTEEHDGGHRISAYELSVMGSSTLSQSRVIYTSPQIIRVIKTANEGSVIVAASEKRILIGALRSAEFGSIEKIRYEFRILTSAEIISALDVRVSKRNIPASARRSKLEKTNVVDIVVGDVKGVLFVYSDVLRNLIQQENHAPDSSHPINLMPRKLHWHRKAVYSVKWSLDGNYIISGGSETVLVVWQLDTGFQLYLPHLSATIQNIVVSPYGTSYAIHLGDNSTMIVSTAELTPTANMAGIQAHVIAAAAPLDSRVWRVTDEKCERPLIPRVPAAINPALPHQLIIAVGEDQEMKPASKFALRAPFLQTFNIASNQHVSRQAITRTNVTNKNITPSAHRVSEASASHIQISYDGLWLATVDQWLPPKHDIEFLDHGGMELEGERRHRREVYLKFWQWSKSSGSWGLVSRIDAPHVMAIEKYGAGRVLALATDPKSLAFATLGEDGIVQIWRPRIRKRDGVVVRGQDSKPLYNWSCLQRVSLGTTDLEDEVFPMEDRVPSHASLSFSDDGSILAAAISGSADGVVHLVDPSTGSLRSSYPAMFRGDLISMSFLGKYIITLSDDLRVYDAVLDERKYGMTLGDAISLLSLEQKLEMIHIAVDRANQKFAIALPVRGDWDKNRNEIGSLLNAYSEIAVFDPGSPRPLYIESLPALTTALLPAVSSPGFVILDASAEVRTVSPKASQTLASMAKPMVELRLDIRHDDEPAMDLAHLAEAEENDEADTGLEVGANKILEAATDTPLSDLDDGPPVVTQHQLAEVLDVGPSFALPPIEEMFYRVASLFSGKPVAPVS